MKKQFYATMAAMLAFGMASAQSVSVIGKDGSILATYELDQVNQIVFTPGEDTPDTPEVEVPDGWIGIELEEGLCYEGIELAIDAEAIAEELDVPSLSTNYVTIYAVQGNELSDNYTAAGDGGFWFNINGEICTWGDEGCAVYAEFYNDDEAWYVGQFPETLKAGDHVAVTIVMEADGNRYDFPLYFYCVEGKTPDKSEIVYEETISGDAPCTNDYTGAEIAFDSAAVAAALGLDSAAEARVILQNADGTWATIPSASNGFYMTADGSLGAWGDPEACPWYIEYRTWENESAVYVGEYGTEPNTSYSANFGLWANDKIALLHVTLNVGEDQRPAEDEE